VADYCVRHTQNALYESSSLGFDYFGDWEITLEHPVAVRQEKDSADGTNPSNFLPRIYSQFQYLRTLG
jgi:hypothetical protein